MSMDRGSLIVLFVGIGVLVHVALNILADTVGFVWLLVLGAALVLAAVVMLLIRRKQEEALE